MEQEIIAGLVKRGLPLHVAQGFALNFQDESGMNPGINENSPTVPGSRGGYGLYQLTGPRRVAYEQFAQSRGIPLDSVDGQLDFLMTELQGPESQAAQAILGTQDAGQAAAAIVNKFLRPAEQHRAARAAKYAGGYAPKGGGEYQAPPQMQANALAPQAEKPQPFTPRINMLDAAAFQMAPNQRNYLS